MKLNLKEYTDTLRTISLEILVLCAQVIFKLSFIYLFIYYLVCFIDNLFWPLPGAIIN